MNERLLVERDECGYLTNIITGFVSIAQVNRQIQPLPPSRLRSRWKPCCNGHCDLMFRHKRRDRLPIWNLQNHAFPAFADVHMSREPGWIKSLYWGSTHPTLNRGILIRRVNITPLRNLSWWPFPILYGQRLEFRPYTSTCINDHLPFTTWNMACLKKHQQKRLRVYTHDQIHHFLLPGYSWLKTSTRGVTENDAFPAQSHWGWPLLTSYKWSYNSL